MMKPNFNLTAIEELKENLLDALKLVIDVQKEQTMKEYTGKKIIKRRLLHLA